MTDWSFDRSAWADDQGSKSAFSLRRPNSSILQSQVDRIDAVEMRDVFHMAKVIVFFHGEQILWLSMLVHMSGGGSRHRAAEGRYAAQRDMKLRALSPGTVAKVPVSRGVEDVAL